MKKFLGFLVKLIGKLIGIGLIGFVAAGARDGGDGEGKRIYYVVRPLLNKHYDAQVRDRRIV